VIRTILDVAPGMTPRQLERVLARAERSQLLNTDELRERVRVEGGRRGIRRIRALLRSTTPMAFTRSQAEERFLQLLRTAGIPEPECNVRVGRRELDFLWRDHRVAVEVDGFAFHASRHSFEGDRARDFDLGADGVEVRRVTWRQIDQEPFAVVRRLAATLTRAELRRA
jgi:very-short-patch-repair endonuclease